MQAVGLVDVFAARFGLCIMLLGEKNEMER
jgi:hypothetical protein